MHTISEEGEIESHVEGMMFGGLRTAFFFLGTVGDVLAKLQLHNLIIYLCKKMWVGVFVNVQGKYSTR